jgi:RNA-binding protein 39
MGRYAQSHTTQIYRPWHQPLSRHPTPCSDPWSSSSQADRSRSRDPSRQRHRDDRGDREERRSKRSRSRSRTRSRSRRRDRSRDRHRDRSYDRHRHRDRRDTGRRDTRDTRRYTDRRERAPKRDATPPHERELRELDRDTRTVFAFNLNLKASEKELFQFFVTAGPIVDIKIIRDRTTGRGKGFAYIEYQHKVGGIKGLNWGV